MCHGDLKLENVLLICSSAATRPTLNPAVQGVCHRDLKLENVLLAGDHAPLVKICDFGYSKVPSGKLCSSAS